MGAFTYASRGSKATITADVEKASGIDDRFKAVIKSALETYMGEGEARVHMTGHDDGQGNVKFTGSIRTVKAEEAARRATPAVPATKADKTTKAVPAAPVVERRGIQVSNDVPVAAVTPKA